MGRFLFVTAPFTGHTNPMVPISAALRARGHEVDWLAHEQVRPLLQGESVRWLPAAQAAALVSAGTDQSRAIGGMLRVIEAGYAVADAMMQETEDAIAAGRPQVVLTDIHMTAGGIAARRADIEWATSFPSNQPIDALRPEFSGLKIVQQVNERRAEHERRWGLAPSTTRTSSALTLAYTIPELVNGGTALDIPGLHFIGAVSPNPQEATVPFPWERLDGRPLVYVALGTVIAHRAARFFRAVLDGLTALGVQVVISAPDGAVPPPWGDSIVVPYAPQFDLIARARVMIGHGGGGSTWECLRFGVPMVIAPGLGEQDVMAQRIAEIGAGLRVSLARPTPDAIATAVKRLLDEPSFAAEAQRLGAAGLVLGGEHRAADALEALAQQQPS